MFDFEYLTYGSEKQWIFNRFGKINFWAVIGSVVKFW